MLTYLKVEWVDRFDPDYAYLKQAIRTALAASLALIFCRIFSQWQQAYWTILAAAFLMQTRLGNTLLQQIINLAIAGICSATLAWAVSFMWPTTVGLAIFLSISTFVAVYLGQFGISVAITTFFINLFIIMSAGLMTNAEGQNERFCMILIGTFLAILMSCLWPNRIEKNWQSAIKVYFLCLAEFNQILYKSYRQQTYLERQHHYEEYLHERRNRSLRHLNNIRHNYLILQNSGKLAADQLKQANNLRKIAESLLANLIALGNIRHRLVISHYSLLPTEKLNFIHQQISYALKSIAFNQSYNLINLQDAIIILQNTPLDVNFSNILLTFTHHAQHICDDLQVLQQAKLKREFEA